MLGFQGKPVEDVIAKSLDLRAIAYEFGFPATGPSMEWLALERLRKMGVRPDVVLLELHPLYIAEDPNLHRPRFLPEERAELATFGYENLPIGADTAAASWFRHRHWLVTQVRPEWLPNSTRNEWRPELTAWGTRPLPESIRNRRDCVDKVREVNYASMQTMRLDRPAEKCLEATIAACQRDGISVALVLAPDGDTFRSWYPDAFRTQMLAFARGLAARSNVPLVNAWAWYDDDAFADSHHLIEPSANDFSARLAREIVVPLLAERLGRTPTAAPAFHTTSRAKER